MRNLRMAEGLESGDILDVSPYRQEDGTYVLPETFYHEGKDYCDAKTETWIWSIGKRIADNVTVASTQSNLYQHPDYECLWLR